MSQMGSGWRCVKSEDFGQTYIYEPALPANSPTPGPLASPWGPSYPMKMAEMMSQESTARNRAILEETTNSCHFESTFFMSPLGGDGYGKTTRDIPTTISPGPPAPPLGSMTERIGTNPFTTMSGMTVAQAPRLANVPEHLALGAPNSTMASLGAGPNSTQNSGQFSVPSTYSMNGAAVPPQDGAGGVRMVDSGGSVMLVHASNTFQQQQQSQQQQSQQQQIFQQSLQMQQGQMQSPQQQGSMQQMQQAPQQAQMQQQQPNFGLVSALPVSTRPDIVASLSPNGVMVTGGAQPQQQLMGSPQRMTSGQVQMQHQQLSLVQPQQQQQQQQQQQWQPQQLSMIQMIPVTPTFPLF